MRPIYSHWVGGGAGLADRIAYGAKAGDLPIERPRNQTPAFNAATAKAIAIKIPKDLLRLADEIYE